MDALRNARFELRREILGLVDGYPDAAFNLDYFVSRYVSRELARAMLRDLAAKGAVKYYRGLWTEDGEMAGAGYGITDKGERWMRVWGYTGSETE